MSEQPLVKTPVVYIVFNRPELTARSFDLIRRARPERLFVVADGPRSSVSGEDRRCAAVREIVSQVDWPCEVTREYAEENLGCMRRITSGLDAVFAAVPEAIILEDDCMPDLTFFRYCDELLERYRDQERVGAISGDNFQPPSWSSGASYYFSRYPHCWGWATWRRAWLLMDREMSKWADLRQGDWLRSLFPQRCDQWYWRRMFDETYAGRIDSWGFRWTLTCWVEGLLTALPDSNLVTNVGFGGEGTHNQAEDNRAIVPTEPMTFPLRHPDKVARHAEADDYTQRTVYLRGRVQRFKSTLRSLLEG